MTQNNKKQSKNPMQHNAPIDASIDAPTGQDVNELKRDMRSAKITHWLQKNQQLLITATVIVLLAMAAGGLWSEKQKAYKESAAVIYSQALSVTDDLQRITLLQAVIKDYTDTGYSILAHIRLAPLADTELHLRAVMDNNEATPEFRWQARLDLAYFFIKQDKKDASKILLNEPVGAQYQQIRYYLLSKISTDDEQRDYLQQALDEHSNDDVLKADIEAKLAEFGS
ncbi:MAG: tetratricopeptide repeat protein [Mariprofundaceae bacterium]|nr:tetratricopeptide repeat protein [Mariprofundaceae bacterium]